MTETQAPRRITFRDTLRNREFRAMYFAESLSMVGNQLALVAVALLLYSRTHSALYPPSLMPLGTRRGCWSGHSCRHTPIGALGAPSWCSAIHVRVALVLLLLVSPACPPARCWRCSSSIGS